ncbi:MAG: DUF983 domain-containing protein [Pacificimonas sp.]
MSEKPDVNLSAALTGKCPRCGRGKLFRTLTGFADKCASCGLRFERFNVGDGASVFLILILNTIGMIGVLLVHFRMGLPLWLNLAIWAVILITLTIGGLRAAKGLLLALEYRNDAIEGRLKE